MKWMNDEEYMELTGLELSAIEDLAARGKLTIKVEEIGRASCRERV